MPDTYTMSPTRMQLDHCPVGGSGTSGLRILSFFIVYSYPLTIRFHLSTRAVRFSAKYSQSTRRSLSAVGTLSATSLGTAAFTLTGRPRRLKTGRTAADDDDALGLRCRSDVCELAFPTHLRIYQAADGPGVQERKTAMVAGDAVADFVVP